MKYRLMFTFSGDQQKKQNAGEDQLPGVQDPVGTRFILSRVKKSMVFIRTAFVSGISAAEAAQRIFRRNHRKAQKSEKVAEKTDRKCG